MSGIAWVIRMNRAYTIGALSSCMAWLHSCEIIGPTKQERIEEAHTVQQAWYLGNV